MTFSTLLQNSGIGFQALTAFAVVLLTLRIKRMEAIMRAIAVTMDAKVDKDSPRISPFVPMCLLLLLLTTGCVQTRFQHGETVMTRTAFLTGISVPSLELTTNGTFKASVASEPKTEVIAALLKLLASMPK